jgi:hypothetical protein
MDKNKILEGEVRMREEGEVREDGQRRDKRASQHQQQHL